MRPIGTKIVGLKVAKVLKPTLLLCEIPDVETIGAVVKHNGKTYLFDLNPNFVPTFADLRFLGYKYVSVDMSEDTDGLIDSVCVAAVSAETSILDFMSKHHNKFQGLDELWWVVEDNIMYLFGWWD